MRNQHRRHQESLEALDLEKYMAQMRDMDSDATMVTLNQSLSEQGIVQACAVEVAHQTAIENYENAHLYEVLIEYYQGKAIEFKVSELPPVTKDFKAELKAAQEVIHGRETRLFVQAQTMGIESMEQAIQIRGSGESTYEQRVRAQKYLLMQEYPEAPWNESGFVRTAWVESRGEYLAQCTLYWAVQNLEKQKEKDQRRLLKQAQSGMIGLGAVSHQYKKAALIQRLGVLPILKLEGYTNSTPQVQAFWLKAQEQTDTIRLYLGLMVSPHKSPVRLLNEILRAISFAVKKIGQKGARGRQERVYQVTNRDCTARTEILVALDRAYHLVSPRLNTSNPELNLDDTPVVGGVYCRHGWRDKVKILAIEGGKALVKFIGDFKYLDAWVELAAI